MDRVKVVFVGVIADSGKYLIIKRNGAQKYDPGRWEFVSMMAGTGSDVALLEGRVKKETGLKPQLLREGKAFKVVDEYGQWSVQPFLFEHNGGEVTLDASHDEYRWVTASELKNYDTVKDLDKNIKAFKTAKLSAGLLVYRYKDGKLQVLLAHPGGPYWTRKDVWGIPKGECDENEPADKAAKREFEEELGHKAPPGKTADLGEIKRSDGKIIKAAAVEGDIDTASIVSNTVEIEWPPRSGKKVAVPEIDKAAWLDAGTAIGKMHKGQDEFVKRLCQQLNYPLDKSEPEQSSLF